MKPPETRSWPAEPHTTGQFEVLFEPDHAVENQVNVLVYPFQGSKPIKFPIPAAEFFAEADYLKAITK